MLNSLYNLAQSSKWNNHLLNGCFNMFTDQADCVSILESKCYKIRKSNAITRHVLVSPEIQYIS